MPKAKQPKQRPEKYAEKVKLNISMDEALKALAVDANNKVRTTLEEKIDKLNADRSEKK